MQAEDRYGQGGYQCASPSNEMTSIFFYMSCFIIDVGSGEYRPIQNPGVSTQAPVGYGATNQGA